jgi:CBS domain-containing protein
LRTVKDILDEKRAYRTGEDLKHYLRKQLDVLTIQKNDSAAHALDKLIKNETAVLIVMDNKAVAGMTTDRDYLRLAQKRRIGTLKKSDDEVKVAEMMTPKEKLITVSYTDTAETCQDLMVKNKVRFLPVVLSDKLHGVLSFSDFLAKPSRFEPEARRAIFAEEGKNIVTDDYSFSLTDLEGDKMKEELAKRVEAIKNRKL